jgi:hypothetical protein
MKHKDWSKFLLSCSGIDPVFTRSKGSSPLTEKQVETLAKTKLKEEKSAKDLSTIEHLEKKAAIFADPPLSRTAIQFLTERYAWEKYSKKTASTGNGMAFLEKGYVMEADAIKLLSKIDKRDYQKNEELFTNEFIAGKCDIISPERGIVIDVKTSWNINTFLKVRNNPLNSKYWYQAQGYMELHNVEFSEICFLLLNTPEDLVSRERVKLLNRFITGEIDRESYEKNCENLAGALAYNNINPKKRVIRFKVKRDKTIMPILYKKVQKCREWLAEFDAIHESGKQIISLREDYVYKENNSQSDTPDPHQGDTGG